MDNRTMHTLPERVARLEERGRAIQQDVVEVKEKVGEVSDKVDDIHRLLVSPEKPHSFANRISKIEHTNWLHGKGILVISGIVIAYLAHVFHVEFLSKIFHF